MLLQILEDGILTDSQGRKVSFKNSVIIMTSNIGSQLLNEQKSLGFSTAVNSTESQEDKDIKGQVMAELKRHFRPEFLNRIDDIIVFHKLTSENIRQIAGKMLEQLRRRVEGLGIQVEFTDACIDQIAKVGYDPVYGARPLRRAITTEIEDRLSEKLLEGKFKSGEGQETVIVDYQNGAFTFEKRGEEQKS